MCYGISGSKFMLSTQVQLLLFLLYSFSFFFFSLFFKCGGVFPHKEIYEREALFPNVQTLLNQVFMNYDRYGT